MEIYVIEYINYWTYIFIIIHFFIKYCIGLFLHSSISKIIIIRIGFISLDGIYLNSSIKFNEYVTLIFIDKLAAIEGNFWFEFRFL